MAQPIADCLRRTNNQPFRFAGSAKNSVCIHFFLGPYQEGGGIQHGNLSTTIPHLGRLSRRYLFQTIVCLIMASLSPSVLRQALRLTSRSALSSASRRSLPAAARVARDWGQNAAPVRSYVTETKSDNAQVQVETAIRLDRKELEKSGLAISAQDGSDVRVSPMAGMLPFFPLMLFHVCA